MIEAHLLTLDRDHPNLSFHWSDDDLLVVDEEIASHQYVFDFGACEERSLGVSHVPVVDLLVWANGASERGITVELGIVDKPSVSSKSGRAFSWLDVPDLSGRVGGAGDDSFASFSIIIYTPDTVGVACQSSTDSEPGWVPDLDWLIVRYTCKLLIINWVHLDSVYTVLMFYKC